METGKGKCNAILNGQTPATNITYYMKRLLLILPILFEAISEGLELHGYKVWGKQVEILELASWFYILWIMMKDCYSWNGRAFYGKIGIGKFWQLVLIYFLLRTVFFNYTHNIAAGLPLDYIGTVSFIDKIVALLSFGQWWMIGLFQAICGVFVYLIVKNKI